MIAFLRRFPLKNSYFENFLAKKIILFKQVRISPEIDWEKNIIENNFLRKNFTKKSFAENNF